MQKVMTSRVDSGRPLCVDLDGTLLATDVLWESLLILLKTRPLTILLFPLWLLRGKGYFKRQLAQRVAIDPAILPYRRKVLSFLKQERASGKDIILTTASDQSVAERIAGYLGIFSGLLASDGAVNLSGTEKLKAIQRYVGDNGFDYIGNASIDIPLWKACHRAILVQPRQRLVKVIQRINPAHVIFAGETMDFLSYLKAIRLHQWVKNFLIFVPLILAHKITEVEPVIVTGWAFLAFSLCSSGSYILNDLIDLESDRKHPIKQFRPFAAGMLPISTGLLFVPLLIGGGFVIAVFLLPVLFAAALGLYTVITTAYSFYLKRIVVLDVIVLAGLYTLRILSGAAAIDISISPWLLSFSMFFFLSLAFVKRYCELSMMQSGKEILAKGRGYLVKDNELLRNIGVTSGFVSVLVIALYINSKEVTVLYQHPEAIWLICPLLMYWITRVWLLAHRGEMLEDPVLFALKDPTSYAIGGLIGLIIMLAAL